MYTAVFVYGMTVSVICKFCRSAAGQLLTVFTAGQPAGRTDTLPAGSGHKNLDQFHLCSIDCRTAKTAEYMKW